MCQTKIQKKNKRPKSALKRRQNKRKPSKKSDSKTRKKVAFTLKDDELRFDKNDPLRDQENSNKLSNLEDDDEEEKIPNTIGGMAFTQDEKDTITDELTRTKDRDNLLERTKYEIDDIKRQYQISLYGKPSNGDIEVNNNETLLRQQHPDPQGSENPDEDFILKPDPIMRLNQCVGMHPRFNSKSVLFHQNPKYASCVLYGTANIVISLNTKSMAQKFLFDHTDHVCKVTMTPEFIISAAKPYHKEGPKFSKRK
jgi:hypothetical protein